ncbi:YfhO family protein [Corallococcus sp. RDP092CA]|uniref:YfhO family protein n=1 Tax=Corallococcus sp. RDP092CA TaxID=3109369 RepID=UPI0035B43CB2
MEANPGAPISATPPGRWTSPGPAGARGSRVLAEEPLFGTTPLVHPAAPARIHLARPECVATFDEALPRMMAPEPPASGTVIVECPAPLPVEAASGAGAVRVSRESPERFSVEVEAEAPSVLVINDAHLPGWTATLDGEPASILAANVAVRAVPVPAGRHTVVMRYRTPGLLPGLWLGALGAAMVVSRRRARKLTGAGLQAQRGAGVAVLGAPNAGGEAVSAPTE